MKKYVEKLFLLYLLCKPYYLFDSGGLQIGDSFLVAAFLLFLAVAKFNKKSKAKLVEAIRTNGLFIIFTALTFVINSLYFIYFGTPKFLMSSLYYVFIFFAIILFSTLGKYASFLASVGRVLKFNLIVQLLISLLGVGRDYSIDRYMGTFNDPNQFGFYILISCLFIYAIDLVLSNNKKLNLAYLLITLVLIIQSASTGSLLGLAVFIFLQVVYGMKDALILTYSKVRIALYSITAALLIFVTVVALSSFGAFEFAKPAFAKFAEDQSVTERIAGKISKADNKANISIWEDRGYDIIYKYPQYIPFGAGEGGYTRYTQATNNYGNEIHATFPSMLFYYGIIPFAIIAKWFYDRIRKVDIRIQTIYAALLVESFILLNQRQSLFWLIFVLGGLYAGKLAPKRSTE